MKTINLIIIILFLTGVIGGFFYWFGWRPSHIREKCWGESENYSPTAGGGWTPEKAKINNEDHYQQCLHSQGLQ